MTSTRSADPPANTFIGLLGMVLRHPRLLLLPPLMAAVLAGAIALIRGPQYIARAEVKPGTPDNRLASLAGLAAQFGVGAGVLGGAEGVEYVAAVLRSNQILGDVVKSRFAFSQRRLGQLEGDSAKGTLIEIWNVQGATEEAREARAIRRLRASMVSRPNLAAGLVRLDVTTRWPELSVQINRRFLQALEAFNLKNRQSQATAQRRFVEQRLADMRTELTNAEDALLAFENRNRVSQAPGLALDRQRLQRRVDVSQQVYLTLAQAYEQARIDEVRDTPVFTVVDAPENTVEQAGGLLLFVLLGGFVGGLVGLGLILLVEIWRQQALTHPDDAAALRHAFWNLPRRLLARSPA